LFKIFLVDFLTRLDKASALVYKKPPMRYASAV